MNGPASDVWRWANHEREERRTAYEDRQRFAEFTPPMTPRTETIVFVVVDDTAAAPFWEAFKSRSAIYGMKPIAAGCGDHMTVPSEIAEELRHMDADNLNRAEIKNLIERAEKWDREQMATLGLSKH